jgi:hypothetical protein
VREAAHGQPLFVLFALVDHSVNVLRQDFSGLQYHRLIAGLQLLIDGQGAFDGAGATDFSTKSGIVCVSGDGRAGSSVVMACSDRLLRFRVMTSSFH